MFTRPSTGGGGFGDPLERDPEAVKEDLAEGYLSIERALKDYGVVLREIDADMSAFELDLEVTRQERARIRAQRREWLEAGSGDGRPALPTGQAGHTRRHSPVRRHRGLGHR